MKTIYREDLIIQWVDQDKKKKETVGEFTHFTHLLR
jgi:hypothetical protein